MQIRDLRVSRWVGMGLRLGKGSTVILVNSANK